MCSDNAGSYVIIDTNRQEVRRFAGRPKSNTEIDWHQKLKDCDCSASKDEMQALCNKSGWPTAQVMTCDDAWRTQLECDAISALGPE